MTRRALVTGGAGFIGSHVADEFLRSGYEVEIVDDLSTGDRSNVPDGATLHVLDAGGEDAARLLAGGRFDVVCHLAAQLDVRKSVADPVFDARANIVASVSLLEAAARARHRPRFVFASTGGAIYGDGAAIPTPERHAKRPASPYGIAKLAVEHYLAYYAATHGLETVALRFANVYGPRQGLHGEAGVVAIFCKRILQGAPLTVYGDGRQTRDYVFVGDVARAHLLAATRALPPAGDIDARAFNLGTGIETDVNTLALSLATFAGRAVPLQHAPARAGEQARSVIDWTRANDVLGWAPDVRLLEGLALTYQWFGERRRAESELFAPGAPAEASPSPLDASADGAGSSGTSVSPAEA